MHRYDSTISLPNTWAGRTSVVATSDGKAALIVSTSGDTVNAKARTWTSQRGGPSAATLRTDSYTIAVTKCGGSGVAAVSLRDGSAADSRRIATILAAWVARAPGLSSLRSAVRAALAAAST